jgi:hypothetical protein
MTLEEFLRWDDGTETHYELISGFPVAMAPSAEAYRILAVRLATRIDIALAGRRPCNGRSKPEWSGRIVGTPISKLTSQQPGRLTKPGAKRSRIRS